MGWWCFGVRSLLASLVRDDRVRTRSGWPACRPDDQREEGTGQEYSLCSFRTTILCHPESG